MLSRVFEVYRNTEGLITLTELFFCGNRHNFEIFPKGISGASL